MKKLVLSAIVALALSAGLYFVLTLGFEVEPPAASFVAAFVGFVAVAFAAGFVVAAFAGFVAVAAVVAGFVVVAFADFAALAVVVAAAVSVVVVAAAVNGVAVVAREQKLKYSWTLFLLSVEAGSLFGAMVVGGLAGIGIVALGLLVLGSLPLLPQRVYLQLEKKTGQVAGAR